MTKSTTEGPLSSSTSKNTRVERLLSTPVPIWTAAGSLLSDIGCLGLQCVRRLGLLLCGKSHVLYSLRGTAFASENVADLPPACSTQDLPGAFRVPLCECDDEIRRQGVLETMVVAAAGWVDCCNPQGGVLWATRTGPDMSYGTCCTGSRGPTSPSAHMLARPPPRTSPRWCHHAGTPCAVLSSGPTDSSPPRAITAPTAAGPPRAPREQRRPPARQRWRPPPPRSLQRSRRPVTGAHCHHPPGDDNGNVACDTPSSVVPSPPSTPGAQPPPPATTDIVNWSNDSQHVTTCTQRLMRWGASQACHSVQTRMGDADDTPKEWRPLGGPGFLSSGRRR